MSEPRKNRLSIDGGQVKEDEHVATYKALPESDTEFRSSKSNLGKSKEKISADGAEEKLLQKEDEAKIVTRVDMSDAKYVVGDHRNGDAKIELDANKRQYTGMPREEVLKYADDPFWSKIRWVLFVVFWVSWFCMLAGAIAIIVQAPKCYPPEPRTWPELVPLVELDAGQDLELLKQSNVEGALCSVPTYDVLTNPDVLDKFKNLFNSAKEKGIRIVVDLIPNFVSTNNTWFQQSRNGTEPYTDYFVWTKDTADAVQQMDIHAFTKDELRQMYYFHQICDDCADLNFLKPEVVEKFDNVIKKWMGAGASGVRLSHADKLIVESIDEKMKKIQPSTDLPKLKALLARWSNNVTAGSTEPTVYTLKKDGSGTDLLKGEVHMFRPPYATPIQVTENITATAKKINDSLGSWPLLQLKDTDEDRELASFAMLLPATPLLTAKQLPTEVNDTSLSELVKLRSEVTISHGKYYVGAVPSANATEKELLVVARWRDGHVDGLMAVYNPSTEELHANLTTVPQVPEIITIKNVSPAVQLATNYTDNNEPAEYLLVPSKSTVVISYVPEKPEEGKTE